MRGEASAAALGAIVGLVASALLFAALYGCGPRDCGWLVSCDAFYATPEASWGDASTPPWWPREGGAPR
jgi:hypothetical protein